MQFTGKQAAEVSHWCKSTLPWSSCDDFSRWLPCCHFKDQGNCCLTAHYLHSSQYVSN